MCLYAYIYMYSISILYVKIARGDTQTHHGNSSRRKQQKKNCLVGTYAIGHSHSVVTVPTTAEQQQQQQQFEAFARTISFAFWSYSVLLCTIAAHIVNVLDHSNQKKLWLREEEKKHASTASTKTTKAPAPLAATTTANCHYSK